MSSRYERIEAQLVEVVQVSAALGAEVERDRNCDVSFERRAFHCARASHCARFPLVSLFERLALIAEVGAGIAADAY
jgi:hypothetical protein